MASECWTRCSNFHSNSWNDTEDVCHYKWPNFCWKYVYLLLEPERKHTERAEAVYNIHTYKNFRHNNIGTRQHSTSSSLYAGIEYDVCSICAKWHKKKVYYFSKIQKTHMRNLITSCKAKQILCWRLTQRKFPHQQLKWPTFPCRYVFLLLEAE